MSNGKGKDVFYSTYTINSNVTYTSSKTCYNDEL